MPVQNKPIIHARDHEPGGADPIRFPTVIPENFEQMALAWSSAYWKLEEAEPGMLFTDELPGHHDLEPSTEGSLTRGVLHGPAEPDSIGIILDGGTGGPGGGTEGPHLDTLADDQALGVIEGDKVGFFAVVNPDPASPYDVYTIAGVRIPGGGDTPFQEVRWALVLEPTPVPPPPEPVESWGYRLAAVVHDGAGGGPSLTVIGGTLLAHPLGMTMPGEEFDVGFNYTSSVVEIYVNGQLEESAAIGSLWNDIDERTGRFQIGTMNFADELLGGWWNYHGGIGMAMLTVGGNGLTSGQMHALHTGEPTVGGIPGEITPTQHGTIPTGDLHPEYVQEAEVTAKGDLLAGTGAGALDELPVGADGQVLVADSTEPTGLVWADPPDTARQFFAQQHGPLPASPESSGMYRVPYLAGAVVEYTLERASLHLGEAGTTTTTLVIEKSETTDEFTPITVATLSCGSGSHLDEETAGLGTIESGNLLRFTWTAIGTGADMFHVQLEGTET